MPNRILKDWTASEKIDQLSAGAEVFFIRLIMKADDYGIYLGNPKLLKSTLYPLRDDIKDAFILDLILELVKAKICIYYEVEEKKYIKILEFGQRLRAMRSKYPEPDEKARTIDSKQPPEEKRNETEVETEVEAEASDILLVSISDEKTLNENQKITFSFWQLFKHNLQSTGIKKTTTLDKAKLNAWTNEIRLMIETDKRTIEELKAVYKFLVHSNFWKKNIQSTKKLREKFERLYQESITNNSAQPHGKGVDADYIADLKRRTS